MTVLGDVLEFAGNAERIKEPANERFVTVKLNCGGAVQRQIGAGKTPAPFTGYRVREGQFIYSRIDARNGAFATIPAELDQAVVSKDFPVFNIRDDRVLGRYLTHFFRSGRLEKAIRSQSRGATNRQRIKEEVFLNFPIALPPIHEQRRIAAILDHADALLAKRRRVLTHLDSLSQSIFHEMFGEPGDLRWDATSFGELIPQVDNGSSPNCESRPAASEEWGVLKLGAVTYGVFQPDENKAYLDGPGTMKSNEVRAGDVLMTRKNTRDLVGAVALVDEVRPRLLLPDLIFRLHLDQARLDRRYFHALMMNPRKRSAVRDLSSGSAASMPNISKARLATLPLEVPPLDLQKQFAAQVERINVQRDAVQRALAVNDECFASLQSRAFRGEL